jgi:hypothetical protein
MQLRDFGQLQITYDAPIIAAAPFPGGEGRGFGTGTGRIENRVISGNLRWTNLPSVRSDNMVLSNFNGIIEPDEGDIVLFRLHGYAAPSAGEGPGVRIKRDTVLRLVFTSQSADYGELNSIIAMAEGIVISQPERLIGFRVYECVYEPPALAMFGR